MLISPLPGTDTTDLRDVLREVQIGVKNVRGAAHEVVPLHSEYIRWVEDAVLKLGPRIASADLDALVLTRRHWQLAATTDLIGSVLRLLQLELTERERELDQAVRELDEQLERWHGGGQLVVPDASVFIQHPQKLEDLDFATALGLWVVAIRVVLPMVVIDELDGLKSSKGDDKRRWRAGYSLAVIDRVLRDPRGWAQLREADFTPLDGGGIPRGAVRLEIVFDPRGHRRLPIADDEIIDRAVAVQTMAGRQVTLLTFDTGQSTRGRAAGLRVVKLDNPRDVLEP